MHRSCVAEVNGTVAGTAVGSSSLTPRPDLLTSLWLHAAITWGWPQHMFVYPGVKWVYGDFAGSALDCPALKFRSPQSSHQGKADGWDRLPDFVQRQPSTLAMNPFRHLWLGQPPGTAPSFSLTHYIFWGVFCLLKGFCGAGRGVWHQGLGTWVYGHLDFSGFLQCHVVMVKGEAATPSNACGVNRGSHEFFVLYRNNNKIYLRRVHSQNL